MDPPTSGCGTKPMPGQTLTPGADETPESGRPGESAGSGTHLAEGGPAPLPGGLNDSEAMAPAAAQSGARADGIGDGAERAGLADPPGVFSPGQISAGEAVPVAGPEAALPKAKSIGPRCRVSALTQEAFMAIPGGPATSGDSGQRTVPTAQPARAGAWLTAPDGGVTAQMFGASPSAGVVAPFNA